MPNPDGTPAVGELCALPYEGTMAFSRGFVVDDFREQYAQHGEGLRWFKAFQSSRNDARTNSYQRNVGAGASSGDSGRKWQEQTTALNGVPISDVRVLVWEASEQIADANFGRAVKNVTRISAIPDEVKLSRGDRIVLTAPARALLEQDTLKRGTSTVDALPLFPVAHIARVWDEARVYVAGTDYTKSSNNITWLAGAGVQSPASGARYNIEYARQPVYEFSFGDEQLIRPDVEGNGLPQRGQLMLLQDLRDFAV